MNVLENIKDNVLDNDKCMHLAELFKVLGDYTRIRIISVLKNNELCVCDIAKVVEMTQSSVSHQLRVLKSAKLVKFRKDGKEVYYSLDDEHINLLFNAGLEHVNHN